MIKRYTLYMFSALMALAATLSSCQDDTETFDNKIYINSSDKTTTLLLKGNTDDQIRTIQAAVARPAEQTINIVYKGDLSLVDQYNATFYDNAIPLLEECYEITDAKATIPAGGVKSTLVEVVFKNLDQLNRDNVYVLPVTIDNCDIDILQSARTTYYVIKGAALINTVANIHENKLTPSWSNKDALNGLSQLTVETLVRVDQFDKLISTIMGIEGSFLIRIGDAGVPDNQIQVASSRGNVTDPAWQVPLRTWVHIAVTFDSSNGATEVYFNGIKKGNTQTSPYRSSVSWGSTSFWIGRSYDDNRFLSGDMSEARIWNRVLTAEEINEKNHFYSVDPESNGLVAYWKFDDGSGLTVKDHTANANHAVAANDLTWKAVELPN